MLTLISRILVSIVVLAGPLTIAWTVITKPEKPKTESTTEAGTKGPHAAFTGDKMHNGVLLRST